jgi:hypothetical protein
MSITELNALLSGMLVAGNAVSALFFLRFFDRTRDRLFAWFAGAFGLLGAQRLILALASQETEDVSMLYLIRLAAFVIILIAIVDKNRQSASSDGS